MQPYHLLAPSDDPRRVVVTKMSFVVDGRDPLDFDLTGMYWLFYLF